MPEFGRVEELSPSRLDVSGYRGLSRRERRVCIAASLAGLAALFVLGFMMGPPIPVIVRDDAARAMTLLEFRRPVEATPRTPPRPKPYSGAQAAAPRTNDHAAPNRAPTVPVQAARAAPIPLPAPLPIPAIASVPARAGAAAATSDGGKDGTGMAGAGPSGQGGGAGSGSGSGSGNGDGDGDGAEYAQAEWIERPPEEGIDRLWQYVAPEKVSVVTVQMICRIIPAFKPRHCRIIAQEPRLYPFGTAAVRLVELAKIRPISKDGSPTDLPVIVNIVFTRPIPPQ